MQQMKYHLLKKYLKLCEKKKLCREMKGLYIWKLETRQKKKISKFSWTSLTIFSIYLTCMILSHFLMANTKETINYPISRKQLSSRHKLEFFFQKKKNILNWIIAREKFETKSTCLCWWARCQRQWGSIVRCKPSKSSCCRSYCRELKHLRVLQPIILATTVSGPHRAVCTTLAKLEIWVICSGTRCHSWCTSIYRVLSCSGCGAINVVVVLMTSHIEE